MAFLEITGRVPDAREADVFNALLITLVEHGMTPQAIAARMVHTAAPEALQAAVAAGLCGVGTVFAGGSEQTARMLQVALKDKGPDVDLAAIAEEIVQDHRRRKVPVPGHRPSGAQADRSAHARAVRDRGAQRLSRPLRRADGGSLRHRRAHLRALASDQRHRRDRLDPVRAPNFPGRSAAASR